MTAIFSVQNDTGTVAQFTLLPSPSPSLILSVGDTFIYSGFPDDNTPLNGPAPFAEVPGTVIQVLDSEHFSVSTNNANLADWPAFGMLTWTSGENEGQISTVVEIDGANAYMSVSEVVKYHLARGNVLPATATDQAIQQGIVKATDYLDGRYRYSGVKLLQSIGTAPQYANAYYFESWLTPYALFGRPYLSPTTSTQSTEWPRQGVIDFNGDVVNGIPKAIKHACAELTIRVLNGIALQPDYDPGLVGAGGVVSSVTKKVGPLETIFAYDTKLGLGFFATFPVVDRLLSKSGLLFAGGGRTVIR